jgi:hypothetical protein
VLNFPNLENLVVFMPTEHELQTILSAYSSKLKNLEIISASFNLNLEAILTTCPGLVYLRLSMCRVSQFVANLAFVSPLRQIEIITCNQ